MSRDLLAALRTFADSIRAKHTALAEGEAEAQLTAPISTLIETAGKCLGYEIVVKAESRLAGRAGVPDFALVVNGALCGYVELKAPGRGADTSTFKGRDLDQWERFKSQPNILYTDGNQWCLYQNGSQAGGIFQLSPDLLARGSSGIGEDQAAGFAALVTRIVSWSPVVAESARKQAELLAPLCRLLRDDVADALRDPDSPLVALAADWRRLLFPDASDERFADAYAQIVTFALLLARTEGAEVTSVENATRTLAAQHSLLSRALQVLTDPTSRRDIEASLGLLQRVIGAFPSGSMEERKGGDGDGEASAQDPWLYFYEHFLAAYDPKLRKDFGVFYTPVEVVRCQVALVDELLRLKLDRHEGFASRDVVTLDPAVGTGTYLLGVISHALAEVEANQGAGAVGGRATALARNLFGFEIMSGPYAVSELRLTRALRERGAILPTAGLGVLLCDTLESPFGTAESLPLFFQPIAEQHARALEVKDRMAVIVCIGNPPYDRHDAVGELNQDSRARSGGWVRWGDGGDPDDAILSAFIRPARLAGHGASLKNLYNLYVYFWRWALWKVFQQPPLLSSGKRAPKGSNAGIISFITASSYLRGEAFVGLREALRRLCHEVYIIDLGGEGRCTRREENVFNIKTPVAICIAVRKGSKSSEVPAKVLYASIGGTRREKYSRLDAVRSLSDLDWELCPQEWQAPFRPSGTGEMFLWPLLTDLMPWQSSGAQLKRSWPIAPNASILVERWGELMRSSDRAELFKETRDRKISRRYPALPRIEGIPDADLPLQDLDARSAVAPPRRYGYRSFDRQFVIPDNRLGDYLRPTLWRSHVEGVQLYFASLFTKVLGAGPALTVCADIPDMDFFSNRGAKDIAPLYRDAASREPNVLPGFLEMWGERLGCTVTPEKFAAYIYGVAGHAGFVERFWKQLEEGQLRVPLTLAPGLFETAVRLGSRLIWLHTYAEHFASECGEGEGLPVGKAKVVTAIDDDASKYPSSFMYDQESQELRIGDGVVKPVIPEVWQFEVSGLRVVKSWLGYRMSQRKGKKSSRLDDIRAETWTSDYTDELLKLIWLLEVTVEMQPELSSLLSAICSGSLLMAADLPVVPAGARKGPVDEGQGESFAASGDGPE